MLVHWVTVGPEQELERSQSTGQGGPQGLKARGEVLNDAFRDLDRTRGRERMRQTRKTRFQFDVEP
jgi:hypothetical protein